MPFPAIDHVQSSRLTLRPLTAPDLADLLEVNGDPEVTKFLPYATWQSIDDGAAWLSRVEALASSGTGRQLVIVRRSDSKVIGTLLLFRYEEASGRVELGYVLGRAHWRQGLMHEAIDAACSYAFRSMNIRRIEAEVDPANLASCELLLRSGFALEGTLRKRWVAKGVAHDSNMYGYLEADWRKSDAA